jgi:HPt (histidine-containing phosphotransfer) domain-containing protein
MTASLDPMRRLLGMLPEATRAQMVRMYADLLQDQLHGLDAAMQAPDAATTALLHKLAGSAGMMQDQDLSQPARAMEKALREGRPDDARVLLPQVRAAAACTLQALREL